MKSEESIESNWASDPKSSKYTVFLRGLILMFPSMAFVLIPDVKDYVLSTLSQSTIFDLIPFRDEFLLSSSIFVGLPLILVLAQYLIYFRFNFRDGMIRLFGMTMVVTYGLIFPIVTSIFGSRVTDWYFSIFRIGRNLPIFADLRTILFAISCPTVKEIDDLITCDNRSSKSIFNYPTFLLLLRKLGVGDQHTLLLGFIINMLVILSVYKVLKCVSGLQLKAVTIIIASPSMASALNQLNLDLIVFISLAFIYLNYSRLMTDTDRVSRLNLKRISVIALLLFASLIKFYPAIVLFVLLILSNSKFTKRVSFASILTFVLLCKKDFSALFSYSIAKVSPPLEGSYGLTSLFGFINLSTTNQAIPLMSIHAGIYFGLVLLLCVQVARTEWHHNIVHSSQGRLLENVEFFKIFVLGSPFVLSYFSIFNYPYRGILLIFFVLPGIQFCTSELTKSAILFPILTLYLFPHTLGMVQNSIIFTCIMSVFTSITVVTFVRFKNR